MNAPFPLKQLLAALPRTRVGVIGDFCLDVYWTLDDSASEISVETALPTRPVRTQRYGLGGAGNVVNNLLAMGVGRVAALAVVGDDPFGREMQRLLEAGGADLAGVLTQAGDWATPTYCKPLLRDREENRLDFGNFNHLADDTARALLARLEAALPGLDAVIVNQQIPRGIHTPLVQQELNRLFQRHPEKIFILDSRALSGAYDACLHKLNAVEATRLCGGDHAPDDVIPLEGARAAAAQLYARWGKPLVITRGSRGCLVRDGDGEHLVPGLHIVNPVDPVGAGDSLLAGLAAGLAAGYAPAQAAAFGNFVAGVTVQKLFQTGTATPDEILAIGEDPDYVYEPELADDPRSARYLDATDIEIIVQPAPGLRVTHAIFDHDGTISTLRQGWEDVMEPMMVRAVLGDRYADADETLYARVVRRVREFIDRTTGIQTLVQMQGLVRLVREFGAVPEKDVLDEHRYKAIYLDALMEVVRDRLARLARGELDVADFTVKGAPEFLRRLAEAGVQLYLASGTDEGDLVREAEALGYAPLFQGRIYGAVGDVTKEAKRIVLDRILADIGPANVARLAAFGDGPVEIRETRKRSGLAVGVASDEVRRYGLSMPKRARLIRAGAHLVVPDYSQADALAGVLGVG